MKAEAEILKSLILSINQHSQYFELARTNPQMLIFLTMP